MNEYNAKHVRRATLRNGAAFHSVHVAQANLSVQAFNEHRQCAIGTACAMSAKYGDFATLTARYAALQAPVVESVEDLLSARFTPADSGAKRAMVARKVQQAALSAMRQGPKPWYGCAA